MIERTYDAGFFNRICNLQGVREWLGCNGKQIDVTDLVCNPLNYALKAEDGGFILLNLGGGVYSVHTQFDPKGSGSTVAAMRDGFDFMFTRTDCLKVISLIPDNNKPAMGLGRAAGFRKWFRSEQTRFGPAMTVALTLDDWVSDDRDGRLQAEGHAFHEMLEAAKREARTELPVHDDDPAHDRYVGACALMAKRGQAAKGVGMYNSWAAAAGYAQIQLLSAAPPVVDVVDGIVHLNQAGEMEVLRCR